MTTARATLDAAMTEREFQRSVIGLARQLGWRVAWTWNSLHSPKGWPDTVLARRGRLVVAELKRQSGKTTPEQDAWLAELTAVAEASGGNVEAHLWRPADWEKIVEVLR